MRDKDAADRELMRALLEGDASALESLIAKWERPLYSFSYRYTQNETAAREIVQETFVRVFTKRARYRFRYPFSSWIFTIAANLCKNRARWRKRHPEVSLEGSPGGKGGADERQLMDVLPAESPVPGEALEQHEALDALKRAVLDLPHDLRAAVLLRHYEDLSYKDIAKVVGCSPRGVETRLYRARKLLRSRLSQLVDDGEATEKKTVPLETRPAIAASPLAAC